MAAQRANTEIMPYDVAVRTAQGLLGPERSSRIHGTHWSEP